MSSIADTKSRLLDAAERLFAREGLSRTSLRSITCEAGVNVAAVHYHFGSKDELLGELIRRRITPVNRERLERLDRIETAGDRGATELEQILLAFVAPAFRLRDEIDRGGAHLVQLFGRLYAESEEILEPILREQFGEVGRRFLSALARALPALPVDEVTWRFQFAIGVLTHALLGKHELEVGSEAHLAPASEAETIDRLVVFLAAGFRAAVPGAR